VKALAASKTMTLRSSCRLRPRLRLLVVESGVALAQRSLRYHVANATTGSFGC
jgi:hypothetical protein